MLKTKKTEGILIKINKLFETPFEIREKNWFLKKIIKKGVTISIGNAMYVDKDKYIEEYLVVHEAMHYADRCILENGMFKKSFLTSISFYIKYAFPQCLFVLSFLSFFNLWFLLFLLFALPNPYLSFFRREYEIRGYFFNYLYNIYTEYSKIFGSMTYYKMDTEREDDYYIKRFKDIAKNPDEKTALLTNVFWY